MRRLISAVLLGAVLALAACGGDGGGDDANKDAPRLSAAQYRAQLNQLCQQSEQEASQIGGVQGANAAALADYFDKIAALQSRRRAQFEALRPPTDLQDEHTQISPLLVQEIAAIKQAAVSFRAGSDPAGTYDTYKKARDRVLKRQAKLLDKLKVAQCRSDAASEGGQSGSS